MTTATLGVGRYAPSPTGELHVGNLRTAMVAWALARQSGRRFVLRVEDIDQERSGFHEVQLRDLEELGIDWDGPVVFQSNNFDRYRDALADLERRGLTFECYCSRREIREAVRAPHSPASHYPGTCLHLSERERAEKKNSGRPAAIRLRPDTDPLAISDVFHGQFSGPIDALVLQRNDGAPAYNLAVVVDDAEAGVDQVVRGDDLLEASPGQAKLTSLLGSTPPTYAHVPLVLGSSGARLAKRDGAVTLAALKEQGWSTQELIEEMSKSLGVSDVSSISDFMVSFNPEKMPLSAAYFTSERGFFVL